MAHHFTQHSRDTNLSARSHHFIKIQRQIFIHSITNSADRDYFRAESACFVQYLPTFHFHGISHSAKCPLFRSQANHAVHTVERGDPLRTIGDGELYQIRIRGNYALPAHGLHLFRSQNVSGPILRMQRARQATRNANIHITAPHGFRRFQPRALPPNARRSEEHTSELQSRPHLVCRLLLEKKKKYTNHTTSTSHRCYTTDLAQS